MTRRVYEQLQRALWLEVLWIDLSGEAVEEHRAIVDAVLARDGKRACEAARRHVRCSPNNMSTTQNVYLHRGEIGRASCRERVCQYVKLSVIAVSFTYKEQRIRKA